MYVQAFLTKSRSSDVAASIESSSMLAVDARTGGPQALWTTYGAPNMRTVYGHGGPFMARHYGTPFATKLPPRVCVYKIDSLNDFVIDFTIDCVNDFIID